MVKKMFIKLLAHANHARKRLPKFLQFIFALVGAVFVGILGNRVSEGEGLVMYICVVIVIVFVAVLWAFDRRAKKKKVRGLFWLWVFYSCIFFCCNSILQILHFPFTKSEKR
jgi:cytochrome bd-type quinol oxidase subunit 2